MHQNLKQELIALSEPKYRDFSSRLLPNTKNILGVRLPRLRKIARTIAASDWKAYLENAPADSFEEIMLKGMVIGYIPVKIDELLPLIADFIPLIDNWSVCDSFCSGLKAANAAPDKMWSHLHKYLTSDKEYSIRFGVVMIINYFQSEKYITQAFEYFDNIKHEGYYVKMAVAWAVSAYYTSFPDLTIDYLSNCRLDDFTYNKALQKITESLKVTKEEKAYIRSLKRHR